jgi:hypothetical protein
VHPFLHTRTLDPILFGVFFLVAVEPHEGGAGFWLLASGSRIKGRYLFAQWDFGSWAGGRLCVPVVGRTRESEPS